MTEVNHLFLAEQEHPAVGMQINDRGGSSLQSLRNVNVRRHSEGRRRRENHLFADEVAQILPVHYFRSEWNGRQNGLPALPKRPAAQPSHTLRQLRSDSTKRNTGTGRDQPTVPSPEEASLCPRHSASGSGAHRVARRRAATAGFERAWRPTPGERSGGHQGERGASVHRQVILMLILGHACERRLGRPSACRDSASENGRSSVRNVARPTERHV